MTPTPGLAPDRPSDAAIAQAFWNTEARFYSDAAELYEADILTKAKVIDAAAPPSEAPAILPWEDSKHQEMVQTAILAGAGKIDGTFQPAGTDRAEAATSAAIDTIALEVARRFTQDTEPQRRASLQCAVIDAISQILAAAPAAPAGDALLQRVIGDVESGDYDGGISEATYNSISAYLAAAAAAPAPFPSGNIHSPIQDTPPEYSRAGTPDAPAAPATNPDEISSKLVEPAAPAEGDWIAMISGIDEYGPMLDWNKHWSDVGVGTKLYTAPRVTGGREVAESAPDEQVMTLAERIGFLKVEHGGLRRAAEKLDIDPGYLSRLYHGEKESPSDDVLRKLGLVRRIGYAALQAATGGEVES